MLRVNPLTRPYTLVLPVQCEYFALQGIMQLINTIMLALKKVNPNLDILIRETSPIIITHAGHGAYAVMFYTE